MPLPVIPFTSFFRENKEALMRFREALLMIVDIVERGLQISPTTAEMRKANRQERLDNTKA